MVAPQHRRRGGFVRSGAKRITVWVGYADQAFVTVASGAKTIVANFSLATVDAVTVVRSRGVISIAPSVFSADLPLVGAFGIGIVSNEAFVAGAASVPGPFSSSDWDGWMVLVPWAYRYDLTSDIGRLLPGSLQITIDSKAMRKMSSNETLVMVAESETGAIDFAAPIRTLLKLS